MSVTTQQNAVDAASSTTVPPAADFGDVRSEFQALVAAAGVYELSARAKVSLTGSDRVRWLNGMVTNNIRDLAPGQGVYAFLLNPQGHILGDLYAYNRGESLLIDTDQSQLDKILAVFDKYIIMDDVEVTGEKLASIGIAGPKSRAALQAAGVRRCPTSGLCNLSAATWQETAVTLVRGDNPRVESFELWLAPGDLEKVYGALVRAGARAGGDGGA